MQYLTVPDYATNANLAAQQNMRNATLTRIQRTLVTERPRTMEDCVAWARSGWGLSAASSTALLRAIGSLQLHVLCLSITRGGVGIGV
jgi:hypothetical protein